LDRDGPSHGTAGTKPHEQGEEESDASHSTTECIPRNGEEELCIVEQFEVILLEVYAGGIVEGRSFAAEQTDAEFGFGVGWCWKADVGLSALYEVACEDCVDG
jgi:hypothetical protein